MPITEEEEERVEVPIAEEENVHVQEEVHA